MFLVLSVAYDSIVTRSVFDSYDWALTRYQEDIKSGKYMDVRLCAVLLQTHNSQRIDPFVNTPMV